MREVTLLEVAFTAPLSGIGRGRKTLHALDADELIGLWLSKRRTTATGVCGARFLHPVGSPDADGGEHPVLWPPAVKGLPWERCRECFEKTGKKRPRARFVPRSGINRP